MIFKQSKLSDLTEFKQVVEDLQKVRDKVQDIEIKLNGMALLKPTDHETRLTDVEIKFKQLKDLLMAETPNKQPSLSRYGRSLKKMLR
jgi:hypothetical protein